MRCDLTDLQLSAWAAKTIMGWKRFNWEDDKEPPEGQGTHYADYENGVAVYKDGSKEFDYWFKPHKNPDEVLPLELRLTDGHKQAYIAQLWMICVGNMIDTEPNYRCEFLVITANCRQRLEALWSIRQLLEGNENEG